MTDFDPWERLDQGRRDIYERGEAAAQVLRKYETIERWHEIGQAADALMQDAMTYGASNTASGRGYNQAWQRLSQHVPTVRDLDKAARSAAVWMAQNWEIITTWLGTLPASERLKLNHPAAVRRRYDAAHKPPTSSGAAVSPRIGLQDHVIKLQAEIDLLRKKGGGGLLPGRPIEELHELIRESHSTMRRRHLAALLVKGADDDERQEGIERRRAKKR